MHVIVSKSHKKLVVPAIDSVRNLFPDAPVLPDGNPTTQQDAVIVDHGFREMLILRHLGFDVPSPLMYYDWCGGKPFDVQRKTVEMLTENAHAYVLNHMGTGKTKSALWGWDCLYEAGLAGKALVVAPLSTLNFVWGREVFSTMPHRKVVILHGSKAKRLERLNEEADIYVINHDGLKVIAKELHDRTDITTLILDELAVYRNNSARSKQMRKFAQRFDIVWGLTGAPMPNEPTDVWAQCKIVTPNTVPEFRRHAEDMLMRKVSTYIKVPKDNAVETAFSWMQPAVRYALDDVVELPDIVSRTIDVDMSDQQKTIYGKVFNELCAMVSDKTITALNAGVAMGKLLQVAAGWVYTKSPEYVQLDSAPRIQALLDILDAAEQKVLVFIPYRHALNGVSGILTGPDDTKPFIDHAVIHGETTGRDQIFNLFQNTNKYKVLLAHPECLSHGLTLTVADTIVWYSPIPSLETYDQANARIRRVGQKHKQQILHLQSTPVERKIYSLLRRKQKVQDQLLSMFEQATLERV